MLRTPHGFPRSTRGFVTQKGAAVLLAAGGGALALLAFVIPKLADGGNAVRGVHAGAPPALEAPTEETEVPTVDLVPASTPHDGVDEAASVPEQAGLQFPQQQAAATVPLRPEEIGPDLKFVRVPGRIERITPAQARERQREAGSERRKRLAEAGQPPERRRNDTAAKDPTAAKKLENVQRAKSKYPARRRAKGTGRATPPSGGD